MVMHILLALLFALRVSSQASGYFGYSLQRTGDQDSAVYETADTPANVSTTIPPPDVYLNATVNVSAIDITVQNLTAQVNLNLQVLKLLQFNAGVDASIDRVALTITNVSAKVILEARLANLVLMVDDVLNSLDANPLLATLGQDIGSIANSTLGSVTNATSSILTSRADQETYTLAHNVLYSVNNYSGNKHTNRILSQSGSIIDQSLDNNGHVTGTKVVGSYNQDMHFNGYNRTAQRNGQTVRELEYTYSPFPGLNIICAIYVDASGNVVGTQVLSEFGAEGSSTISNDS